QPCFSTAQRSSLVETRPPSPALHGAQLSNLRGALQMSSPPCGASTPEPNGSTSPGNSSFRLPAVPSTSYLNPRIQPATGSSSPGKKEKVSRSAVRGRSSAPAQGVARRNLPTACPNSLRWEIAPSGLPVPCLRLPNGS